MKRMLYEKRDEKGSSNYLDNEKGHEKYVKPLRKNVVVTMLHLVVMIFKSRLIIGLYLIKFNVI